MLTQERLKELLHYDEELGVFIRKTRVANRMAGSISGAIHNKGYVQITVDKKNYLAHRLVWFYVHGYWPKNQIDHINRNKKDNRIKNLSDVTNSINQHNIGVRSHNSSGFTGVYKSSRSRKWIATIEINGKKHCLGTFDSINEAASTRHNAESKVNQQE